MKKKSTAKVLVFYAVLIGIVLFASTMLLDNMQESAPKYSDVIRCFDEKMVDSFTVDEDLMLTLTLKDGKSPVKYRLMSLELFLRDLGDTVREQYEAGIIKDFNYEAPEPIAWWVSFLPYVIVIALFVVLWVITMNQAAGKGGKIASFGRAKTKMGKDEKKKVLFADVAGADEEKEELHEIVDFLRDPARYSRLGAKIPHGVLLMGPPGTGKTLLAKAVAGEADVPFFSISGSDFVEMYVGVGASRVRDLFDTAKKAAPSIIFIDEIDAVGRHRGAGLGGGHDEREQTLNQLLVEMDGFGNNEGVIVMAATNRSDILDPALLRPGRFDRQIVVSYPDLRGREEILKVHAKNKPFEGDVDLAKIAQTTVGFTGADLANLLNEAALTAARKGKSLIGMTDIEEASMKIIVGIPKKNKIKESEKRKTAFHEAGHAIVAHVLPSLDPVRLISIIPSGRALGFTLNPPKEDKYSVYKSGLKEEIAELLGGRVAEKIVF
ncbi:MAG: ATP-dependent zinc metalloprotease FtsH, partial [Clostridia bacterium]|nr:ATP-dependent zinc metalloprotease FtsH [Clostridia bacterium]